jgi:hypothetical protein
MREPLESAQVAAEELAAPGRDHEVYQRSLESMPPPALAAVATRPLLRRSR